MSRNKTRPLDPYRHTHYNATRNKESNMTTDYPPTDVHPVYRVDLDCLSMVFGDDDSYDAREAIDAIADRVETELARRGIVATVERDYRTTGKISKLDIEPRVWDAVMVDGADDIRAAVLTGQSKGAP